jgi:hypothetical protein
VPLVGFGKVYVGVGQFAKWTQTLAGLEVVHAALGMFDMVFSSCSVTWFVFWIFGVSEVWCGRRDCACVRKCTR